MPGGCESEVQSVLRLPAIIILRAHSIPVYRWTRTPCFSSGERSPDSHPRCRGQLPAVTVALLNNGTGKRNPPPAARRPWPRAPPPPQSAPPRAARRRPRESERRPRAGGTPAGQSTPPPPTTLMLKPTSVADYW